MSKVETSEVIKIFNARLSYPKLFKPEAFSEGQPEKFQGTFLLDPSDPQHLAKIKEIKAAAVALMKKAYGPSFDPKTDLKGVCFGDGNKKVKDDGTVTEGYADMVFVTAAEEVRPAIANRAGDTVAEGDPQTPYGGCFVNGSITLWAQNNRFGKRINANLRGVQFTRDGDAFGRGPVSAESEFDALEDNTPADSGVDVGWDDDIAF